MPASGMTIIDPLLEENSEGFFGLMQGSPAINNAQSGFMSLPQFDEIHDIDAEVMLDLMGQNRQPLIEEKDLGCNEYPHNILIQPIATEENTGPSYNTSISTGVQSIALIVNDLIEINPNPVSSQLNITTYSKSNADLRIDVFDFVGRKINTIAKKENFLGKITISKDMEGLPAVLYTIRATSRDHQERIERIQTIKFIKSK